MRDCNEWPERSGHARILVESPYEDVRHEHAFVLRKAGYEVATCAGPLEGDKTVVCPLVAEGHCALVDGADVVVSTPRLAQGRAIVGRLTARTSPVVVVEGGAPDLDRERAVLRDARVLPLPVRTDDLLRVVGDAAEAADRSQLRYWEDFIVGEITVHGTYRLSETEIVEFARFFDPQPFHLDGTMASGVHTFAICARLITRSETVRVAAVGSPGVQNLRWLVPVRPGDELTARSTVVALEPSSREPRRGRVVEEHELLNQHGETVVRFRAVVHVERRLT